MKLKSVIVDDEPYSQKLLQDYISKVNSLECCGIFIDPFQALTYLNSHKVDVIFLDIEMPNLNGMDLLKSIETNIQVVFTTAYSNYAVESYNQGATDYLVKPVSFDRFLKTVNRLQERMSRAGNFPAEQSSKSFIYVKADRRFIRVFLEDIIYIQGMKDYVLIKTMARKLLIHTNLKKLETSLTFPFLRVHNSYIVNMQKISELKESNLQIEGYDIPVSRKFYPLVIDYINKKLI